MMFRSLAISSSLLALLVSGPAMAMEPEGNERSTSPLKRRAAEENLPEGINKKQKILSREEILQAYPLTPEGNDNLRKVARDGDDALQDEALRRFLEQNLLFTTEDYDLLLRGFCKWENMEADLREEQDYWTALQEARQDLGDKYRKGVKDERGEWLIAPDPLKAKALLQACVDNDDTCQEAEYKLGVMLRKGVKDERGGWLIAPNPLKAMEYFENAAQGGHEKAIVALQQLLQQYPQWRPAVPAAVQNVRSTWKFNPAELRNATENELKLYDEIIGKVEGSSITPAEKVRAKNALLRFKTLHVNNAAICAELMGSPVVINYSERIYAVTPRDIIIHPEQGDANLEQRAHIIHNILETTYAGVKEAPIFLEKFFKEAFSDTIPCLEAQSLKIDDWRASQESIEIKISRQTMVQSIGEQANQLMEDLKKNSEAGKKLIEAQQDYQMLDMKLQGAPPEIHKASLKHTSQNIARLEKKYDKWLKNNNKYGEMRQNVLTALVGKMAQDGEITENAINEVLSGLGWDFDLQE